MDVVRAGRVELRHLRAFEAVARLESFTQAARELSITQPALSRTIQQLEGPLGVRLLDRPGAARGDHPGGTRVFLEYVERVLAESKRGRNAVPRRFVEAAVAIAAEL